MSDYRTILCNTLRISLLLIVLLMPAAGRGRATGAQPSDTPVPIAVSAADGATGDNFGAGIALDGDRLAVGAPYTDLAGGANQGVVYLFARNPQTGDWIQSHKLTAPVIQEGGLFGEQVALQGDTLVVGAPRERVNGVLQQGAVYIFGRNQGGTDTWGLVTTLTDDSIGSLGLFGSDLALTEDLLLIGAEGADADGVSGKGAAYLYDRTDNWKLVKKLVDANGRISDAFGVAVAIAGETVVIGALRTDESGLHENDGAAFVFVRNAGGTDTWGQVARLVAATPDGSDAFGAAVAIDGDTIVVGARSEEAENDDSIYSVGAAYVFARAADTWSLVQRLAYADGTAGDYFGNAVAVAGDTLWVAAQGSDAPGFSDQGQVSRYVHNPTSNQWEPDTDLSVDDGLIGDYFGQDLAVSDMTLAVSAYGRDSFQGTVYVFDERVPAADPGSHVAYLPLVANNSRPPTGTLTDGASVVSETGAVIGAVPGALDTAVDVTIAATAPPALPIAEPAVPVGDYYLVSASETVATPSDKPLLVGLPVPTGATTAHLMAAVLTPASRIFEGDPAAGSIWTPAPGSYDADNNLFVTTLRTLPPEGMTIVLVEHPDIMPLPANAAGLAQTGAPNFLALCGMFVANPHCNATIRALIEGELTIAHADFVGQLSFREPALHRSIGAFAGTGLEPQLTAVDYYFGISIFSQPCQGIIGGRYLGRYNPVTQVLEVCVDAATTSASIRPTVRHELFHAIQSAYGGMFWDNVHPGRHKLSAWTAEGTATAAENSSATMQRDTSDPPRSIIPTVTDTSGPNEYWIEDFWVYTGQELGASLAYLQPIFEQGGTPEHVNAALTLDSAYWRWIKHQTFEGTLQTAACEIDRTVIGTPIDLNYAPGKPDFVQGTLEPLSSVVVEITFAERQEGTIRIVADNDADSDDLKYKVYWNKESGCENIPDGERSFETIPKNGKRHVVLSNTNLDEPFTFIVQVIGG
jgi:hypothetical protein